MTSRVNLTFLRDKRALRTWLVVVLAWASFRAFAINKFFGHHSVNVWGYLVVDLASSVPYAVYSARAVVNFLDKSWITLRRNTFLAALFFYIPDVYVFIFARTVPTSLYVGFGITIIIFSVVAFLSLRSDATKGRA